MNISSGVASLAALLMLADSASAQTVVIAPPPPPPVVIAAPPVPLVAAAPAAPVVARAAPVRLPEGTELPMRLEDMLSSKTAVEGDRFTVSLTEDVALPDGTVLKAGYRGVGEVTQAEKNGLMGKSGKLALRLSYMKVGDQKIRLRATKGSEGKGNVGNQVVGLVFIGVFAAFIKGHSAEIPKGTAITAFTDEDATLNTPLAPPPPEV